VLSECSSPVLRFSFFLVSDAASTRNRFLTLRENAASVDEAAGSTTITLAFVGT
jgi:hypothetical protein